MKKMIVALVIAAALPGCSAGPTSNYKNVDCIGVYTVKTFPFNESYEVKINAERENRFGEKMYRVSPYQKYVAFVNRWQDEDKFDLVRCK